MNKRKKAAILAILMPLILGGCGTTEPMVLTAQLVSIPPVDHNAYPCPQLKKSEIPDPKTLTDLQVALLIKKLYGNNERCYNSNQALIAYIEAARAETQAASKAN